MTVEELKKIVDDTENKKRRLFNICLNKNSLVEDDYNYMANTLDLQAYQKIKSLINEEREG